MRTWGILLLLLALAGCDALQLEPERRISSIEIHPQDTIILEGSEATLRLVVRDHAGRIVTVPPWRKPLWDTQDRDLLELRQHRVTGIRGGIGSVTVSLAEHSATATVSVNPLWDVKAPTAYITQVAQNPDSVLPLLANRKGLLRMFLYREGFHAYDPPPVRVTLVSGEPLLDTVLTQDRPEILTSLDESSLGHSYNLLVPAEYIAPGLAAHVTYDPEDEQAGLGGSERIEFDVIELPRFKQTFVPIISRQHPDSGAYRWSHAQDEDSPDMQFTKSVLPIADREIRVRETYFTDLDPGARSWDFEAWGLLLQEIYVLRFLDTYHDPSKRSYYYGAIDVRYTQGIAGIGFVEGPVSIGIPEGVTYAHELGHNLALYHAPCGAQDYDPAYPYEDGRIGRWGWNPITHELMEPGHADLMGYCEPPWVSWYSYGFSLGYLEWRTSLVPPEPGPVLYLWGGVDANGKLDVNPVMFFEEGMASPDPPGEYVAEAFGANGERVFSHSFGTMAVSHSEVRHFGVAVPYDPSADPEIRSITISGPGDTWTVTEGSNPPLAMVFSERGVLTGIRRNSSGRAPEGTRVIYSSGLPRMERWR